MDDHKWSKVPSIAADMMMVDLEDSVPAPLKEAARERLVEVLRTPGSVGDKLVMARPNHLDSPWGRDDLIAIARAGARYVAYPKIEQVDDLIAAVDLLAQHGCRPVVFAIVETAAALLDIRDIARVPQVGALMFGSGDLSSDLGIPLLASTGDLNPTLTQMKSQAVLAAAANGLLISDTVYGPDLRDLDAFRERAVSSRDSGFTAFATFYPPHVDVINSVLTPGPAEVSAAQDLVLAYERLVDDGRPAAVDQHGRTILIHDYVKAQKTLARSR
nr:aldolase/citrate lyase family protein [Gordonia sp. LAM0048]